MAVILETQRLTLRRFLEADAEALLRLESDPEVLRYVGRQPLADAEAYRHKIRTRFFPYYERPGGLGAWAVLERASGDFIGGCSLRPAVESSLASALGYGPGEIEMGYGLRRCSWGRGYATELAVALLRRAFTELEASCVVASFMVGNAASARVLEKAGLRRVEGLFQVAGEDQPSVKYVLTRDQFDRAGGATNERL